MNTFFVWPLLVLGLFNLALLISVFLRSSRTDTPQAEQLMQQVRESADRLERELRRDILGLVKAAAAE